MFEQTAALLVALAEARAALGEGWVHDGVSLAEGIRRKTRALETSIEDQARLLERAGALVEAVLEAHRDDIPPRIRDLAQAALASPSQPVCRTCGGTGKLRTRFAKVHVVCPECVDAPEVGDAKQQEGGAR